MEAISDPTRFAILRSLASRPLAVGELANAFPISRPAISQHLRVLADAGLVSARKLGTKRLYAIDEAGLKALKEHFDQFWSVVLSDFKAAAENKPPGAKEPNVKRKRTTRNSNRR